PAAALVDAQIDAAALREGWAALKDTHHFHALLKKHGAQRTQALRLAGGEWAERLDNGDLAKLFEAAAESGLPIMVFVGNAHCIQIHTGPVCNLKWLDDWFNVLDPEFNLHLKTTGIAELWRVRKPSTDGIVTSWEAFDADGELIVQLFGARKPGEPERDDWRELAESFKAL
ncbi:hemin-degrading factor, partial [Pseudomonas aeruginosa]